MKYMVLPNGLVADDIAAGGGVPYSHYWNVPNNIVAPCGVEDGQLTSAGEPVSLKVAKYIGFELYKCAVHSNDEKKNKSNLGRNLAIGAALAGTAAATYALSGTANKAVNKVVSSAGDYTKKTVGKINAQIPSSTEKAVIGLKKKLGVKVPSYDVPTKPFLYDIKRFIRQ